MVIYDVLILAVALGVVKKTKRLNNLYHKKVLDCLHTLGSILKGLVADTAGGFKADATKLLDAWKAANPVLRLDFIRFCRLVKMYQEGAM